jgi:hypothetical protein
MVFAKARLLVAAGLFVAWIGFLVVLVAQTRDPVILSRPQLAVSGLVVVATVAEKDGRPATTINIKKVAVGDAKLAGTSLDVEGLADCGKAQGWAGPGDYIVPLTLRPGEGGTTYEVTPLPKVPGFNPTFETIELLQVGPDQEKVAALVSQLLGGNKDMVARGILRRNVPTLEAVELKKKLEGAKAGVRLIEAESRIYRATPDALRQLD